MSRADVLKNTAEAANLLLSAKSFVQQERADEALTSATTALELYKAQNDVKGTAEALCIFITATVLKDGPTQAMNVVTEKFASSKSAGNNRHDKILQAAMQRSVADVQLAQGIPDRALKTAAEAQALSDSIEDHEGVANALLTMVRAHRMKDEHVAALSKALRVVELFTRIGEMAGEATAWLAVMGARIALGKYQDGMKAAEAALVLHIKLCDEVGKAFTLLRIAEAHVAHGQNDKSLKSAAMALEIFRKLKCRKWEVATLDVVVHALIAQGSMDDALRSAKTGVSVLTKAGETDAAALAMKSVVAAHQAKGDNKLALTTATEAVDILLESNQKKALADMLHVCAELHTSCAAFDEARKTANEALKLYRELGEIMGETSAKEILGRIEDSLATFQIQQEETTEAQVLVDELKEALEQRNGPTFKDVLDKCFSNQNVLAEQVMSALEPVQIKDPEGCWDFIKENYPENWPLPAEEVSEEEQELLLNDGRRGAVFDRRMCYLITRYNGMGYGPGFRGNKFLVRKGEFAKKGSVGCAVLTHEDARADWENELVSHAGMYDQGLMAGSCIHWDSKYLGQFYKVGPETTGRFKTDFGKKAGCGAMYNAVA